VNVGIERFALPADRDSTDALRRDDEREAYGPLFYTDDGWLVDLREYRQYPIYGEWDWLARTNNSGVIASGC
jgi:hypothetical protein